MPFRSLSLIPNNTFQKMVIDGKDEASIDRYSNGDVVLFIADV